MSFKSITLLDPMNILPSLVFYPDEGGYNRAIVNQRGSSGRTPFGATKITGTPGNMYHTWSISANIISQEQIDIFDDYIELLNQRLLPENTSAKYLYLEDRMRMVAATIKDSRYSLIQTEPIVKPSYNPLLEKGYARFKVILKIENEYVSLISGCKYKLSFSAEEIN